MFKKASLAIFIFTLICVATALADCPPGSNWTAAWTDYYNQTTYTLEAPCKVYIGVPFNITATVTDSSYPNDWVAFSWAIKDNGAVISGGGFNMLWLTGGQWQNIVQRTYTGVPENHTIEFKFSDMGNGGGAHNWTNTLIGNITVDPYPEPTNTPPTAAASGGGTFQIGETLLLNGAVSDYEGDILEYKWLEGADVLASGTISAELGGSPVALPANETAGGLPLGTHILTLEVNDGAYSVTSEITVNVIDSMSPSLAPVADTYILWPPNHQMVDVAIYANAVDNSGGMISLTATVTSNEPPSYDNNGNIIPDYYIVSIDQQTGILYLQLRAERLGAETGRTYTVTITAVDESGNSSSTEVQIKVPHDMRGK